MPPYAPTVLNAMLSHNNDYKYILLLEKHIKPIFDDLKFEFYNYTDINAINSNDNEFIDGFHGSEITYLKLYINI